MMTTLEHPPAELADYFTRPEEPATLADRPTDLADLDSPHGYIAAFAEALGWSYDGIQKGFDGEPFCHNYTDRRPRTTTTGMTVSVYAWKHTVTEVQNTIRRTERERA